MNEPIPRWLTTLKERQKNRAIKDAAKARIESFKKTAEEQLKQMSVLSGHRYL